LSRPLNLAVRGNDKKKKGYGFWGRKKVPFTRKVVGAFPPFRRIRIGKEKTKPITNGIGAN